ncbi:actin-like ATPase domain-containing protein [Xylaria sp. CBS 124048]|nr:actin-like ATPase domain-containing protein [Xylaria sp. CBS 124048]
MSGQQGKWREEQILIICPGSHTTMAQLGCQELTLPALRLRTRMFKDQETGGYRPYHTYKRKKAQTTTPANGTKQTAEDEWEYVEDRDSVEDAIYPIKAGRIVNMQAFLAFFDHVHGLLTTTQHNTPIVLMGSPHWGRDDCETIARYIFEKTKTPALCLLHSAMAAQYGLKWPHMTVVDIGYEKVDIACIYDSAIIQQRTVAHPPTEDISGGEVFTQELLDLLKDKGFTHEMAEQLKQSPICEVLPYSPNAPDLMDLPTETLQSPIQSAPETTISEVPTADEPVKPADSVAEGGESKEADEGVLDVANIVTSGNTREFLAKREKERVEKLKTKKQGKGQENESAGPKTIKLPNSKRMTNTFHYEDTEFEDVQVPVSDGAPMPSAGHEAQPTERPTAGGSEPASEGAKSANGDQMNGEANNTSSTETVKTVTERRTKKVRKDIEVGLERFLFANRLKIDRITDMIFLTIQSVDEIYKRAACWDNIVIVGNGSRLKGLKENIIQTMLARHLISPSTATIFTSELPSHIVTPSGTGSQTPTGSYSGQLPATSSVNPLLQAATTASLGVPSSAHAPGSSNGEAVSHHYHGQTPMSIKLAPLPNYITDWAKYGFEEAMFLGSLIAGRIAFCIHNFDAATAAEQRMMSLTRADYNEKGPKAIRTYTMMH